MNKLFEILRKNILLLVRSKTSALIVLLGPLVLILLISTAFNTTSLYDIKIGAYSDSYSSLSNSIKTNDIHVCAIFPSDLTIESEENIEFYVDTSRLNLVYVVLNSISSKVSTKSTELSTALTSTLVATIENADSKIAESSGRIIILSAKLTEIKEQISSSVESLGASNFTQDAGSLEDTAEELNATGEAGDLIGSYKSLVTKLESKINTVSELSSSVTSLEAEITNVQEVKDTLSGIQDNINSVQVKEVSKIVSPIKTEIKTVSSEGTHFTYTFPILLVIVLLFSGLLVSSTTVIEEKSSKAFFRNFITPTSNGLFVFGNFLSNLIIILSQVIIIFIVVFLFSGTSISNSILVNLAIMIIMTASVFILLGMLIGYLFKSGETSNLAVITIASILLFFSNTILPLETLPLALRSIAGFNPFILGADALKEILLFNTSLNLISTEFYILLGYIVVLFVLVFIIRELSKRRYIE